MAIAFDAATDGGLVNPGTSLTFAHTCTGNDRILFVSAVGNNAGDNVTGATYNAVAMTLVNKVQAPSGRWTYLFYLIAPATGSNNVVISANASIVIVGSAVSYTGAKQSGQPDAQTTNTATGATSITGTVTTILDNCWLVMGGRNENGATVTAGAGTTLRIQNASGLMILDSGGPITPAGSASLIANISASTNMGIVIASFAPVAVASGAKNMPLLGVG